LQNVPHGEFGGAALATTKFVTGGEEAKGWEISMFDVSKLCSISFIHKIEAMIKTWNLKIGIGQCLYW
jgi:hypothetical protein